MRRSQVDLTTPDGPARLVEEAVTAYGGLDVLVNNVGAVRPRPDGFLAIDRRGVDLVADHQLPGGGPQLTRAALPHLLAAGGAAIVTTCSVNAFLPDPLVLDYSAAKAALANFSKALSKEVGPRGIRSTRSAPGRSRPTSGSARTASPRRSRGPGRRPDRRRRAGAAGAATGRFTTPAGGGRPRRAAGQRRAGNVTGSDFVIDGGLVQTL